MRFMGLTIGRSRNNKSADSLPWWSEDAGGWWPVIREGFAGAWQRNTAISRQSLLAFTAVYSCVNRITSDISMMPMVLQRHTPDDIWENLSRQSPFKAVLKKPNGYQTRIAFLQQWIISKLLAGNTYILKQRDQRGVVVKLYPLDPLRCRPLVTPDGSIYYELGRDPLSEVLEPMVVAPSSEIIHDMMPGLFHPLVGTSPIFACALSAQTGHHIQKQAAAFFHNQARPSGILTAPGSIGDDTAKRLKKAWDEKFSGHNSGAVAVLGDGLKFEAMTLSAADAQMIETLKWTGENVCTAFGVPPFMVGLAPAPTYTNIGGIFQLYLTQCLQIHIEQLEVCMDEGLELDNVQTDELGVALDTEVLLRMDTESRFRTWGLGIQGGFVHPNWARRRENMPPVAGGDSPYLQQQNYSLEALARRDSKAGAADPGTGLPSPATPDSSSNNNQDANAPKAAALTKQKVKADITAMFSQEKIDVAA